MEKICYVGNALLDFSANCSYSMLKKYDLKVDENCEYTEKQTGLIEELLKLDDLLVTPGGSAQNSARVTQWLLKPILGDNTVVFIGCVGKDHFGELLAEKVNSVGVKTFYDIHKCEPTGITAALVTQDDKRTLCARLGAANYFEANFLKISLTKSAMKNCQIIYIEGFFMSHNSGAVSYLGTFAKENDKIFAFNLSAQYICENYLKELKEIIPNVDLLFGNKGEMQSLARHIDNSVTSPNCVVKLLAQSDFFPMLKQTRTVIMTNGPEPVLVCLNNGPVLEFPICKVEQIKDTIGAGDAFVAGYLASLIAGEKDIGQHVKFAIEITRTILENRGCSFPPIPNKNVINLLKNFACR